AGAAPLEEGEQRAGRPRLVPEIEVIRGRVVVVDGALHQVEAEVAVEGDGAPAVGADGRDVVEGGQAHTVNLERMRDICALAVDAAVAAGASYADARAVLQRSQSVRTKSGTIDSADDRESEGIGVRVLVDGAWGFACDRR